MIIQSLITGGRQRLCNGIVGISLAVAGAMMPLAAHAEGTGLVREEPETYRSFPAVPAFRNFLPKRVDLSRYFPPAAHQGNQGSCVGFAVSYGLRSFYENRRRILAGLPPQKFSPSFVYNSVLSRPDDCGSGATVSSGLRFLKANGTVPYENFPYAPDACEQPSETPLFDLASEYRISEWRRVPTKSADQLKGRLYYGDPVVVGMTMTSALNELGRGDIYSVIVDQNQPFEGHAVVLAGYDEERQAFKFFNSWGTDWAADGFGWISYEALMGNIDSAFVIEVPESEVPVAEEAEPETVAAVDPDPVVEPEAEPEAVVEPEPVPEPDSVVGLSTAVRDTIGNFECFGLTRRLKDGKFDGLSGYVSKQEDLDALQTLISSHPDGKEATLDIDVRPWPQCEALSTFSSPLAAAQGLDVRILSDKLEAQSTFQNEDELVIEVTAPEFDSYLYVTYLPASGDAVHFVKGGGDMPVKANSVVRFGLDPKKPRFYVQPPFGNEMIVAIASRQPLFEEDFDIVEEERSYLTRFRKGILTSSGKRIVGNVAGKAVYLKTVE